MTNRKVTAVLLKYQRPKELEEICDHLEQYDFINEILIRDNTKQNLMGYGRYTTAIKARNDTIYVQDDDCIVDVAKLYKEYDGTKLVNGMKESHILAYQGVDSMVGWGALFEKKWIKVFDKYITKYGVDDLIIRESDRLFTAFVPRKTIMMEVDDFPSATADFALYRQGNHYAYRELARHRINEFDEK